MWISTAVELILLAFLVIAAIAVCATRHLLASVILYTSFGLVLSMLWVFLASPDLALTEAAVGAGISGLLYFVVLKRIRVIEDEHRDRLAPGGPRHRSRGVPPKDSVEPGSPGRRRENRGADAFRRLYNIASVAACAVVVGVLLTTVAFLPPFGDPANPTNNEVPARYLEEGVRDTGAVNAVAGMILDYRAFDTYGEANVLFVAACAVVLLLRGERRDAMDTLLHEMEEPRHDVILKKTAMLLVPMIMVFGVYVVLGGHLGPGGGFSGGAVIGASMILYASAYGTKRARLFFSYKTYRRVVSASLLFYGLVKGYSFFTGGNHLPTGIPLGTPGAILSAGLILPLNVAVGLVVSSTMYTFYILFSKGEML